jgi:hypothetical protein
MKGIGDFNGDHKADILWHYPASGETVVWLMEGEIVSSFGTPGKVNEPSWRIRGIGDFDGDGKQDILWHHTQSGQTTVWLMDGRTVSTIGESRIVSDGNWGIPD